MTRRAIQPRSGAPADQDAGPLEVLVDYWEQAQQALQARSADTPATPNRRAPAERRDEPRVRFAYD